MSDDQRAARLAAIRDRAAQATPGPWRWRGNKSCHDIELQSIPGVNGNRLLSVMRFFRWGMQSAMPYFRDARQVLCKPTWVIPQPWNDWMIGGIDHPDARFIEHSREDIDWLLDRLAIAEAEAARLVVVERAADDLFAVWGDGLVSRRHFDAMEALGKAVADGRRERAKREQGGAGSE